MPQDYRQYLIVAQQEAHSPDESAAIVVAELEKLGLVPVEVGA